MRLLCRSCDGHVTAVSFLFLCNQIKNLINMTRAKGGVLELIKIDQSEHA